MLIFHPLLARLPSVLLIALAPLAYLFLCAIAAALLIYPLAAVLQGSVHFDTLVHRGGEVLLILGLFPLAKRLGLGVTDMGLPGQRRVLWRQIRLAFFWGCLMLGIHFALLVGLEARRIDPQKLELLRLLRLSFKGLLIGIAVASIEEPLFRGFLLGSLAKKIGQFGAALISSLYFAALHSLDSDMRPAWEQVHWDTGLMIVLDAFKHVPLAEADGFLALFAAGLLLACLRIWRPLGLGYCIGLHMGWIFVIKTLKPFTHHGTTPLVPGLTSHYDGVIGYLSAGWTAILIALLLIAIRGGKSPQWSHGTRA